jgi:hypothetical protein
VALTAFGARGGKQEQCYPFTWAADLAGMRAEFFDDLAIPLVQVLRATVLLFHLCQVLLFSMPTGFGGSAFIPSLAFHNPRG